MRTIKQYISLSEATEKYPNKSKQCSMSWLRQLCADGKIDGAIKIGRNWVVPKDYYKRIKTG